MNSTAQPHATPHQGPLPLSGVRILDLSRALAGPWATALLGDLGAEIIKVEGIRGGDSSRSWPPFEGTHSLYFDSTNRGKSSVAVDFYSDEGRELLWGLAMDADVLVENFRPGVLTDMGLDPAALRAARPSLIIASVSGFGTSGPLAQCAGLDQVAQGMSGLMSVTGHDADHPLRVGVPIIDMVSGIYLALGIAAALCGRAASGAGVEVATSLLESALSLSSFQGQGYLSTGTVPEPRGNSHPTLSPYGVFRTGDIPIIIAVGTERHWVQLCELIGLPGLADEADYRTGALRSQNRDRLAEVLEDRLRSRPGRHWIEALRSAQIPTGPIYTYEEAFADEQVQSLGMVTDVTRSDGTVLPLLRGPLSIDRSPLPVRKAPPSLGEDTRAVAAGIGLSAEQIDRLVEAGVLGAPSALDGVPA